jgi:hypothetical protein
MRKRTRTTISVSLQPEIWERFKLQADRQETDSSKLLNELLGEWLDEQESGQQTIGTPAIE